MDFIKNIIIILLLCNSIFLFGQEKDSTKTAVAVIGFESYGVSETETQALTDRFSTELFKCGEYNIMEREKMEEILDEMNYQLSGCTSSECAVQIGRIVGVEKIFAGSVSQVAEYYSVNVRMIDVETSQIENTATRDISGSLGKVLTDAIPEIARELSGLESKMAGYGNVEITTNPDSTKVYLDNAYLGRSPLKFSVSPLDSHNIRVLKDGYKVWSRDYTINQNEEKNLDIYLTREASPIEEESFQEKSKKASILIKTHPENAKIYIDNSYAGFTPKNINISPNSGHHIKLEKENYELWENYYEFENNESKELDIYLTRKQNESIQHSENIKQNRHKNAFHIRYTRLNISDDVNHYMGSFFGKLSPDNPFYKPVHRNFSNIVAGDFTGVEFWNNTTPNNILSLNFRIAIYRSEFEDWVGGIFDNKEEPEYDIGIWHPQISADLHFAPFQFPIIHPFFNVGYGYNLLIMVPQHEGKNKTPLTLHAPGLFWGFGIELKPLPFMGFAADYNWRNMKMEVMKTNNLSERFINKKINKVNLSSKNIGISIIFYH